jgi:hypothetical protein
VASSPTSRKRGEGRASDCACPRARRMRDRARGSQAARAVPNPFSSSASALSGGTGGLNR